MAEEGEVAVVEVGQKEVEEEVGMAVEVWRRECTVYQNWRLCQGRRAVV